MVRKGSVRQQSHPVALDRRRDPQVRRRMSGPAIRTFFNIADAWDLAVNEQRALLGWLAPSTYHKYKAGDVGALSFDTLTRLSLVIGIYKALHILYAEQGLADRWVKLPNSNALFGGRPALELMSEGGIDGLYQVRRLLDGRRGGWS
jgi:Antitoxin Xre/MbcA/ParS C-terminal toxin-binding domain/Antitoxin Xre-like helix-turn-helix domain